MIHSSLSCLARTAFFSAAVIGLTSSAHAVLLLHEPFNYTVGTGLGGDQGGTATAPIGYTNASTGTSWSAHAVGAGYNAVEDATIAAGSLSYGSLATSGESVNHGSGLAAASSKYATAINLASPVDRPASGTISVYMSFLVRQNSFVQNNNPGVPSNRFGFAELSSNVIPQNGLPISDAQSTGSPAMPGTVWMRPDIGPPPFMGGGMPLTHSQYGVGKSANDAISADGSATWQQNGEAAATAGSTRQGVDVVPWQNQTYFIVAKYTFNDPAFDSLSGPPAGTKNSQQDSVSIFINPLDADLGNNAGEASAVTTALYSATGGVGTGTSDSESIASFVLLGHRQAGVTNGNASAAYTFDELRIGTTWADVTPTAAPGQPGDFNGDGKVDAADYVALTKTGGNYNDFFQNFGEGSPGGSSPIPEPGEFVLIVLSASTIWLTRRGR